MSLYSIDKKRARREVWALGRKPGGRLDRAPFPVRAIWDHMRIRSLRVSGEAGLREDAFMTVMLAGALSNALLSALVSLIREKNVEEFACLVKPYFQGDRIRLNLEGIVGCRLIHIIIAMVPWYWKKRKGHKTVWHTQSKTF